VGLLELQNGPVPGTTAAEARFPRRGFSGAVKSAAAERGWRAKARRLKPAAPQLTNCALCPREKKPRPLGAGLEISRIDGLVVGCQLVRRGLGFMLNPRSAPHVASSRASKLSG
jgi:hypothetical protein